MHHLPPKRVLRRLRLRRVVLAWVVLGAVLPGLGATALEKEAPREAATQFLDGLRSGDDARWYPRVPREGGVRVQLRRWGQVRGDLGARQARVLLRDLTKSRPMLQYRILRVESESPRFALVHIRVVFRNEAGRPEAVRLHLGLRFEQTRWVVRDIRESAE